MINFEDKPKFKPCYTPVEMFKAGIFGGSYFQNATTLPVKFVAESESLLLSEISPHKRNNQYGVLSGSSLEWWLSQNLIHIDDPNGWVEWYVKFYYGRRHADDDRQIQRFRSFVTRHLGMLRGYQARGKDSAKTKQNLLQWAWNHEVNPTW